MLRYVFVVLVFCAGSVLCGGVQAQSLSLQIQSPMSGAVVGDQVLVRVAVTSSSELATLNATSSGRTVGMTLEPAGTFSGTLNLQGVPDGPLTIRVDATNIEGKEAHSSVSVQRVSPPRVTFSVPQELTLVSTLQVQAGCRDSTGPCAITVRVGAPPSVHTNGCETTVAVGRDTVSTVVRPADAGEGFRTLCVDVVPSQAGQNQSVFRQIVVEPNLNSVLNTIGFITHVNGNKLLEALESTGGRVTAVTDVTTGVRLSIEPSADGYIYGSRYSRATPRGAVLVALSTCNGNQGCVPYVRVLHDGVLSSKLTGITLPADPVLVPAIRSVGRYAVWNDQSAAYRYDAEANELMRVAGTAFSIPDVDEQGQVVFHGPDLNIYRYANGETKALTQDGVNRDPVVGGSLVVYSKQQGPNAYALAVYDGTRERILAEAVTPWMVGTFATRDGWVAYVGINAVGQRILTLVSPSGESKRIGLAERLEALGEDGRVVFVQGTGNSAARYLASSSGAVEKMSTAIGTVQRFTTQPLISVYRTLAAYIPEVTSNAEGTGRVSSHLLTHSVRPHPIGNWATLAYSTVRAGWVSVEMYDALGRRVSHPVDGYLEAGAHEVHLDAEGLPVGVYVLVLHSQDEIATRTVVKAR